MLESMHFSGQIESANMSTSSFLCNEFARISSNNTIASILKSIRFVAILAVGSQVASCVTFSDGSKSIVANNEIVVVVPEDRSSVPATFNAPCISYVCPILPDRSFTIDYNFAHDVATNIKQIIDARGKKSPPRYYLHLNDGAARITTYLLSTRIFYVMKADLRDESGNSVGQSNCTGSELYGAGTTYKWRDNPGALKDKLKIFAKKCTDKFRTELNI